MNDSVFTVRLLSEQIVGDFWSLHSEEVDHGWCCCTAWWAPSFKVFGSRTAEENKEIREELFAKGQYEGFILYENGTPIGWCQCGSLNRLKLLCEHYHLMPDEIDDEVQAISCLFLVPSARGRGLAHRFINGVIEHLRDDGCNVLKAFPCVGDGLSAGEVWTGPAKLFSTAGFLRAGGTDGWPIYELILNRKTQD